MVIELDAVDSPMKIPGALRKKSGRCSRLRVWGNPPCGSECEGEEHAAAVDLPITNRAAIIAVPSFSPGAARRVRSINRF
jgi:hypothetical protein